MSAAIDYYMYIAVKHRPIKGIRLGYSKIEEVTSINQIDHRIIRAALTYLNISSERGLEIVSIGDLPGGTGMGSSGSFTVGLLNALHHQEKKEAQCHGLAEEACDINMNFLKEPSGKQDEYIASYGGIRCFEINTKGKVKSYPLKLSPSTINRLQNNLLIFYTGISRSSSQILTKQSRGSNKNIEKMVTNLQKTQEIGYEIKDALEEGNLTLFGHLLHKHWLVKREREAASNSQIDKWYDIAIKNGALGGKIMGAGGGGFFAFYCEDKKKKLQNALTQAGLEEVKFHFDFEGTKLLINT